jgi:hypothetical protein
MKTHVDKKIKNIRAPKPDHKFISGFYIEAEEYEMLDQLRGRLGLGWGKFWRLAGLELFKKDRDS